MSRARRQPIVLSRSERARRLARRPRASNCSPATDLAVAASTALSVNRFSEQRVCGLPLAITNRYFGQAAFLIGGGPSFRSVDADRLRASGALTMTLNNAFASYRSDLWLAVDPPRRFPRELWVDPGVMKFTPSRHRQRPIVGRPRMTAVASSNAHFYEQNEWFKREQMFGNHDPSLWDNRNGHGCKTSLMDAIRVLYLLGVRCIYLLGVDFYQAPEHTYHYPKKTGSRGIAQNNRLYRFMSQRLTRLRPLMEQAGLVIHNCNEESKLKAFGFLGFDEAVRQVEKKSLPAVPGSTPQVAVSSIQEHTKRPDVTLITPTGDRPLPFSLCERWMQKQTFTGAVQWIVVDDGATPTHCTMGQQYVRRSPKSDDPRHTLARNLLEAIPHIAAEKVLIVEDDDWYSPHYIQEMVRLLDEADLVGLTDQIYYRIKTREWKNCGNKRRASMCQTGFMESVISTFKAVCEADFRSTDLRLWRAWRGRKKLVSHDLKAKLSVGIKQQPGRGGQTSGWRVRARGYTPDPEGLKLRNWTRRDADAYLAVESGVTFAHSGGLGDIVYAIPTIQALGGGHLYIKTGSPCAYPDNWEHMGGGIKVTETMAEAMLPFLEVQAGITGCSIHRGEEITYDLDCFRNKRRLGRGHLAQHHLDAFGVNADLTKPWLRVTPDESYREVVVINRTSRYHAKGITGDSYAFFCESKPLFIGNEDEYRALKRHVPSLAYEPTPSLQRAAEIIAGCKLFVGCQSCCYAIAEGLKANRVLEVCERTPNCNPIGARGKVVSTEFELIEATRQKPRVLLVGADESNPGDKIVEAGCRHRVSRQWPEAEVLFVDLKHPEDAVEADILVVCGTPWLAVNGGPVWRRKNLKTIVAVSKAARLEAWGIGAIYHHGRGYLDQASVRGAKLLFSGFDIVEVRDAISQEILIRAGVECDLRPCPSMEARHYFGIEPDQGEGRLHIYQSIQTANQHKRIINNTLLVAMIDKAQRACVEGAPVLCYTPQDADEFRREFPGRKYSVLSEPKRILETIAAYQTVTTVRVHGALPALSLGCSVTLLPFDSRGEAAIRCGAKLYPGFNEFCDKCFFSNTTSQPTELACVLPANHPA